MFTCISNRIQFTEDGKKSFRTKIRLGYHWVKEPLSSYAPRPFNVKHFVPHIKSREPRSLTVGPDGPQAYSSNILWLQEGVQVCMPE